ncbi:hypothetical protein FACS18945_2170 [Bacteroidia bacterium]|nr:hypothetical protein FACS18945_2170 [Bacteroidia bacterium]
MAQYDICHQQIRLNLDQTLQEATAKRKATDIDGVYIGLRNSSIKAETKAKEERAWLCQLCSQTPQTCKDYFAHTK